MKFFSRADTSALATWWWTVDKPLLTIIFILAGFGIVLITTASPPVAAHLGLGDYHFLKRHLMVLGPAILIMIGLSFLDKRTIWRLASLIFAGSIIMMAAVLLTGMEIKGARRWIHVFGFSLQPSEFLKPALAIIGAWFISKQKDYNARNAPRYSGYIICAGFYVCAIALLIAQPDLGMTIVICTILGVQIFLAGLPFRLIGIMLGLAAGGLATAYFTLHHVRSRIDRFLDPASGDNFQIEKSLQAFQNGGLLGTGLGEGEIKLLLPDSHADFIFAVAGEEMGLLFSLIILGLLFGFLLRGFYKINQQSDLFSILAVGGLLTTLGMQSLIHISSALHLIPTKGMTLPWISYGGSSLLSVSISCGFILGLLRAKIKHAVSQGGLIKSSGHKFYHKAKPTS